MDREGVQSFTLLCLTILLFEERDKANKMNILHFYSTTYKTHVFNQ